MKQNFFILSFFVFMILIAGTLYANVEEVGDWWGTVTINGVSGNNGAIVETYISGNKVATAIVGEYEKDYYLIHVEGQEGNEVLFKINGFEAERDYWSNEDHRLDLSVTIQESSSDNPPSSSGGGGSSSGSEDIQNTPETSSSTSSNSEETIQTQETEEQETSPGITGAVVGFLGSGKGITAIVILIILGVGVILIKSKPRKWIKKS